MAVTMYISIIALNVNVLNAPIKRCRAVKQIRKEDPCICCLQQTHFRSNDIHRLKVKGWKKILYPNEKMKKS